MPHIALRLAEAAGRATSMAAPEPCPADDHLDHLTGNRDDPPARRVLGDTRRARVVRHGSLHHVEAREVEQSREPAMCAVEEQITGPHGLERVGTKHPQRSCEILELRGEEEAA